MKIKYSKRFTKNFNSRILPSKPLVKKFTERVRLFGKDRQNILLKDHKLSGNKANLRSFSITGDIRVIYTIEGELAYFVDIGTHNQVY